MKTYKNFNGEKIRNFIKDLTKFSKAVEVFYKVGRSNAVFFNKSHGFEESLSEEKGIAIRAWSQDGAEYFFHSSDDDLERMKKIIAERLKKQLNPRKLISSSQNLAEKLVPSSNPNIFCKETAEASIKRLKDFFLEIIQFLNNGWKGMIKVNKGELRAGQSENFLYNSREFSGNFKRSTAYITLNFQLKTNNIDKKNKYFHDFHDFYLISGGFSLLKLDFSIILRDFEKFKNKEVNISTLRTADIEEEYYVAVLSPQAASELLKSFIIFLQRSQRHSAIFSDKLTIVDDGTLDEGFSSSPFDGAGHPSKKIIVVQNGKIINWLDNIVRPSYKDYPQIGPTNLYIKPGFKNQEEIFKYVARGIYLISLKIFKNPNEESRASFIGQGFLIEGGKLSSFIGKILVTTDIKDIFKSILEIGNDLQFFPWSGALGAPTLLIEKVKILPII